MEKLSIGGVFMLSSPIGLCVAGFCAGAVNGLFGAGGGMVLIPLMELLTKSDDRDLFSSSITVILPICLVSLAMSGTISFTEALPYLPGSAIGGFLAVRYGRKIPTVWLHRTLGILIIWGGIRYLC